jgi:hypothetical protein
MNGIVTVAARMPEAWTRLRTLTEPHLGADETQWLYRSDRV